MPHELNQGKLVSMGLGDVDENSAVGTPMVVRVCAFVVTYWRILTYSALIVGIVSALVAAVTPPVYEATTAFTPSSRGRSGLGAVSGFAAQLGLQLDMGGSGDNVAFYTALINSRELKLRTIATRYVVQADGTKQSGDLLDLLEVKGESDSERRNLAVQKLGEMISVRSSPQTNLIEVRVSSKWPDLSEQIADRVLFLVNEYNLERRQSQAGAERKFVQSRVDAAAANLAASESAAAEFLKRNRMYAGSPELSLEYDRLKRRVDQHQQVLTSLMQSLEQARIEEVRDIPVITAIDTPRGTATRRSRGIVIGGLLGLFFGCFLGAGFIMLRDVWSNLQKAVSLERQAASLERA